VGDLAESYRELGQALLDSGPPVAALEPLQKALDARVGILGGRPEDPRVAGDLVEAYRDLYQAMIGLGRWEDAAPLIRRAIGVREPHLPRDPADRYVRPELFINAGVLAGHEQGAVHPEAAVRWWECCIEHGAILSRDDPGNIGYLAAARWPNFFLADLLS